MARMRTPASTSESGTSNGSEEYAARVTGHNRSFGDTHVLRSIDLDIEPGEFVVMLGRSGCGKSTLLRSLARLDPAPAGEIQTTGRATVAFQEPRLLPWRRVRENVEQEQGRVAHQGTGQRHPLRLAARELPGPVIGLLGESDLGQRLIDEIAPGATFGGVEQRQLVIQLWRHHAMAVLLVTHDVDEALALADRVVLMEGGRLAHTWRVSLPRPDRTPSQPEIAGARAEILAALGVRPLEPNPNRRSLTDQGAA